VAPEMNTAKLHQSQPLETLNISCSVPLISKTCEYVLEMFGVIGEVAAARMDRVLTG
jgi:hypothetical protein